MTANFNNIKLLLNLKFTKINICKDITTFSMQVFDQIRLIATVFVDMQYIEVHGVFSRIFSVNIQQQS